MSKKTKKPPFTAKEIKCLNIIVDLVNEDLEKEARKHQGKSSNSLKTLKDNE